MKNIRHKVLVNQFSGGISEDIRQVTPNGFAISKHFDIFSNPNRLTPFRSVKTDNSTNGIKNFLYYNSKLYGLGSSGNFVSVLEKSTPFSGTSWATSTNGTSASGTRRTETFVQYKGFIYGWSASDHLWKFDTTGSAAFSEIYKTISFTNLAQGLVGKDDILYLPHDNYISSLNGTVFGDATLGAAKTLTLSANSSSVVITQIAEYGNYLAIACRPTSLSQNSKVFIWDRSSPDVTDVIDWGEGDLYALGNIEGRLVGISNVSGTVTGAVAYGVKPKIVVKMWQGGTPQVIKQIFDTTIATYQTGQVSGNRFYFYVNGANNIGLFSVGRNSINYPFAVTLEHLANNDTGYDTNAFNNFIKLGDFYFFSVDISSTTTVKRTDDAANFTATSIYESQKFNGGDTSIPKKLVGIAGMYVPLPSGGSITIKYRKDEETSYTTIYTDSTQNSTNHDAVNIESTFIALPDFSEIQFRIESTGGAEPTGFKFVYDELNSLLD